MVDPKSNLRKRLMCVHRRFLWAITKPEPACVGDFSQVLSGIEDYADTLERCQKIYGNPSPDPTSSASVRIVVTVVVVVLTLVAIGFAGWMTCRCLTRKVHRTRETIIRRDDGVELHGFGTRASMEGNRVYFNRQARYPIRIEDVEDEEA